MGDVIFKIKIMPDSPDANLDDIEQAAKKELKNLNVKNIEAEKQPIAFGLVAVIVTFLINESAEQDPITNALKNIKHVNSVQVIDCRRAFG